MEVYPNFNVTLKKGLFWYYLEEEHHLPDKLSFSSFSNSQSVFGSYQPLIKVLALLKLSRLLLSSHAPNLTVDSGHLIYSDSLLSRNRILILMLALSTSEDRRFLIHPEIAFQVTSDGYPRSLNSQACLYCSRVPHGTVQIKNAMLKHVFLTALFASTLLDDQICNSKDRRKFHAFTLSGNNNHKPHYSKNPPYTPMANIKDEQLVIINRSFSFEKFFIDDFR